MSKAEFKFVNTFNQDNVAIKVPVVMQYRLLDADEVARTAEEGKARATKMAEDRVKADEQAAAPLSDDEARKLLAALKNDKSRRDAVQALIKKKEPDGHQDQVARALNPLLGDRDDGIKQAAAEALKTWGTKENVPGLVKLVLDQDNVFIRARAMEALGQLQDKRGAEAVAMLFVSIAATPASRSSRWARSPSRTSCHSWTIRTRACARMRVAYWPRSALQRAVRNWRNSRLTPRLRRASGPRGVGKDRVAITALDGTHVTPPCRSLRRLPETWLLFPAPPGPFRLPARRVPS